MLLRMRGSSVLGSDIWQNSELFRFGAGRSLSAKLSSSKIPVCRVFSLKARLCPGLFRCQGTAMKIGIAKALVLGGALLVGGCQTASVQNKENLLTAAGFTPQPANTPLRQAAMKKFPPNKFVQQMKGTQIVYVYADPIVCQCVYFGSQAAYAQYRSMVFQQNLADEQQMTAMMNQTAFDFDPWGPVMVY